MKKGEPFMKWWVYLLIISGIFGVLLFYSLCVMAGETDEKMGIK